MDSHTPVTCKNRGRMNINAVTNPKVRKNDMAADDFPSDIAVNIAEANIFAPENKKLKEKIENPFSASKKTDLLFPANIPAILFPAKKAIRNTAKEIVKITQKQTTIIFLSLPPLLLPQ